MPYYVSTIKVLTKDADNDSALQTVREALNFLSEQDNSLLAWGFVKTGDSTRAMPAPCADQQFATNYEDTLERERELRNQPYDRLSDGAKEELDFLEEDNEQSFDNL